MFLPHLYRCPVLSGRSEQTPPATCLRPSTADVGAGRRTQFLNQDAVVKVDQALAPGMAVVEVERAAGMDQREARSAVLRLLWAALRNFHSCAGAGCQWGASSRRSPPVVKAQTGCAMK